MSNEQKLSAADRAWIEDVCIKHLFHHPELLGALLRRALHNSQMVAAAVSACLAVLHDFGSWHRCELHFYPPYDGSAIDGEIIKHLAAFCGVTMTVHEADENNES